jgi:hypothetical protein
MEASYEKEYSVETYEHEFRCFVRVYDKKDRKILKKLLKREFECKIMVDDDYLYFDHPRLWCIEEMQEHINDYVKAYFKGKK